MDTSLRDPGPVGSAPQSGPPLTGGNTHEETFWSRHGWLLAAVWVVFLIFPVLSVAGSTVPAPAQVAGYGLIAAFGGTYLWGFYSHGTLLGVSAGGQVTAWLPFTALLVTAGASVPILRADTISFGPFLVSFAAYLLSVRSMWIVNTAVLGVSVTVAVATGVENFIFLLGLLVVLVAVNAVNTTLIRKSMAAEDLRLDYAVLAEQERMARDVHDALGHSLTAVGLKAQLAQRLLDTDLEGARAELQHIQALTDEAMDSIRATVEGMRRITLQDELAAVQAALDDAGITTIRRGDAHNIDPVRSMALAWILREAVTNVLRHAHATTCWIRFHDGSLSVEDDGDSLAGSHEGHGIRGMRERARRSGAQCEIGASDHGGTRVALSW